MFFCPILFPEPYNVYTKEPSAQEVPPANMDKSARNDSGMTVGDHVSPKPLASVKKGPGRDISPKPAHPAKNKLGKQDGGSPGRLGRGRGSPVPSSWHRETPPGSRDISPCPQSDPKPAVGKTSAGKDDMVDKGKLSSQSESEASSLDSAVSGSKKKKRRPLPEVNEEKLKNEYEWQKHKLTHKLKKVS